MNYETLIIDDDRVVCMLINKILDKSNFSRAKVFTRAEEALEQIIETDSEQQHYLIFLDINMPVMNGWEFLDRLKNQNLKSKVYVSVITSSINETDRQMGLENPFVFNYITKPLKQEDVEKMEQETFLTQFKHII